MNENDFLQQQTDAVAHMREMSARADNASAMPPMPSFVRVPNRQTPPSRPAAPTKPGLQGDRRPAEPGQPPLHPSAEPLRNQDPTHVAPSSFLSGLDIPFLDHLSKEGDLSLILGLLLILVSEKADKKLLFALLYILM